MSNDDIKKQAESDAALKANLLAVNNLNQPKKSQSSVPPLSYDGTIKEYAARNRAMQTTIENNQEAHSLGKIYGYVVTRPRQLTQLEKDAINASSLVPKESARGYEYVKFYANGTPTDAIPSIGIFPKGSHEEQMVVDSLPEALHDLSNGGPLSPGQIICIEYREANHGFPVVAEATAQIGGVTAEDRRLTDVRKLDAEGKPPTRLDRRQTIRDKFYSNFEKGELKQDIFTGRPRELSSVNKLVFHETGMANAESTLDTLTNKGAGIHYLLTRDGRLNTVGPWDETFGHVGNWNIDKTSLGVEVDNVVNPVKGARASIAPSLFQSVVGNPDYQHIVPDGLPWKADRKGNRGYVFPSRRMFESAWGLCLMVTSAPSLNIPMKFIGLDKNHSKIDKNLFILTGAPPASEFKPEGREKLGDGGERLFSKETRGAPPGIYAHSYIHHGDGAILSLYCYLRSTGYTPEAAYHLVIEINRVDKNGATPGLVKESNGHWYANLNTDRPPHWGRTSHYIQMKKEEEERIRRDAKFRTDLEYDPNQGVLIEDYYPGTEGDK